MLPLGLSVAALTQLTFPFGHKHVRAYGHPPSQSIHDPKAILEGGIETTIVLGALLLTASYIVGIVLVTRARPDGRRL